jgi:hypothetical protein
MELEEALARIIELENEKQQVNDQNESLKIMNESLKSENDKQSHQIKELKRLNMSYFERLTMETKPVETPQPLHDKTEEAPTWDEFLNQW